MTRRQNTTERKAQIVAEVLRLADEIGPDRLSTTDVARAVGVSQPAIFRHFPSRNALWLGVAEHLATHLNNAWDAVEAKTPDPYQRLRNLIAEQLTLISKTPALPSILFSRELSVENAELRKVFGGLLASYQARLVAMIARLQETGELNNRITADDVAVLLTSLIQGVAIRWTLGARGFSLVQEGLRLVDVQLSTLQAPTIAAQ